ncbi:MAG: type I restriction enzyme HsdR N-terminal domain-containing protein [Candidatus Saccharibacteria bacterium]|nr:type I restriction enzyme HsdR N-terminal domain-containing protein [Candidatus Saccharibacteria bacterium]
MDLWQQFVEEVNSLKPRDEKEYQGHITSIMRLIFHWKDVLTETNIPVGNNRYLRPDIVLKKDDQPKIIIEMKDKNISTGDTEEGQLRSYLLQMKTRFGLLIGDKITLVYNDLTKIDGPTRLAKIEFKADDEMGPALAEVLDANTYTDEKFEKLCAKCLKKLDIEKDAEKLAEKLITEDGKSEIAELLKTRYDSRVVEKALAEVKIKKNEPKTPIIPKRKNTIPGIKQRYSSSAFDFYTRGIQKGAAVSFFDDDSITATVYNNKRIVFRNEITSLSAATRVILTERGECNASGVYQGPKYWKYGDELLVNMPIIK